MKEKKNQMEDNMSSDRGMLSEKSGSENTSDVSQKTNKKDIEKSIEVLNTLIGVNNETVGGNKTTLKEKRRKKPE